MVDSYLRHERVVRQNTLEETFAASRKVFVELSQTVLESDPVPSQCSLTTYDSLQEKFRSLSQRYLQRQEELKVARRAENR